MAVLACYGRPPLSRVGVSEEYIEPSISSNTFLVRSLSAADAAHCRTPVALGAKRSPSYVKGGIARALGVPKWWLVYIAEFDTQVFVHRFHAYE
jgi:hypothetical protein